MHAHMGGGRLLHMGGECWGGGCQGTMTSSKTVAANKEKEVSDSVRMILSA